MIIKMDEYGKVTGAVGNLGELRIMKAWLFIHMEMVYGKENGTVIAKSIPMPEALALWKNVRNIEA